MHVKWRRGKINSTYTDNVAINLIAVSDIAIVLSGFVPTDLVPHFAFSPEDEERYNL
jgi:hypothetical protein